MRIYCAHPINGLSYDDIMQYYTDTIELLTNVGFQVLHPMTGKSTLRYEEKFKATGYPNQPTATNHAIIERDRWMVMSADIVYVNLEKAKTVSIGSVMELAWAHDHGKHTVVVMEKGNVNEHAFTLEAADIIFENTVDAEEYLIELATNGVK